MKRKNKKSQVTIFIIIGIVIVVIVSLIYGISKYASKGETTTAVKKVREAKLNVQPIITYVESCLDRYAKQGLTLLGYQGGRMLVSQGGTSYSFRHIEDASYAIYPPNPLALKPDPNDDPWREFPYVGADYTNDVLTGIFGDNRLPPLTKDSGPHSMQLQLEGYVLNTIGECDLSVFENQFDIVKGTPSVEAKISKDNVIFNLVYPLEISDIATGAKTTIQDFQANVRIRLGKVYEFVRTLVINDVGKIDFNLATSTLYGMVVVVEKKDQGNDLIIISDSRSMLTGSPYQFRFARRNRKPALRYITEQDVPSFNSGDIMTLDNITDHGPRAYDPDEDLPSVNFKSVVEGTASEIEIIDCDSSPITVCAEDEGNLKDCQEVYITIEGC